MHNTKTYTCAVCGDNFERYPAGVRVGAKLCCSNACRGELLKITFKGKNNPNYRHGDCIDNKLCSCGRLKDIRSKLCAKCAGRGSSREPADCAWNIEADTLRDAVAVSNTYVAVAKLLGVSRPMTRKLIALHGVSVDHFKSSYKANRLPAPSKVLCKGLRRNNAMAKTCILCNKLKPYVCSICRSGPTWQGKTLVLQLHHKDGDKCNNELGNLEFMCPNCHSQTNTFTGRNSRRTRQSGGDEHV